VADDAATVDIRGCGTDSLSAGEGFGGIVTRKRIGPSGGGGDDCTDGLNARALSTGVLSDDRVVRA
jgi:hypothetical protein